MSEHEVIDPQGHPIQPNPSTTRGPSASDNPSLLVQQPAKVMRIGTMIKQLLEEVKSAPLDEAARACGSRPFAVAGPLDRARRDLELFLLQHRLEPALARAGREAIQSARETDGR